MQEARSVGLKKLGREIERLRRQRGMTRELLGEAIGRGTSTVYRLEIGRSRATIDLVRSVASALKVRPTALLELAGFHDEENAARAQAATHEAIEDFSAAANLSLGRPDMYRVVEMGMRLPDSELGFLATWLEARVHAIECQEADPEWELDDYPNFIISPDDEPPIRVHSADRSAELAKSARRRST